MNYLTNIKEKVLIIQKNEEKTNATRTTVLGFGEAPIRYKIDLIERDL